ncbi:MAG: molybdopterin converting factor subunit 1 [Polyangiaceae bacterium]
MNRVKVLYFAGVKDLVGRSEEDLPLPDAVRSVLALEQLLTTVHPELAGRLGSVRFAVNESFAAASDPVAPGDVVAVIPPVAGG